MKNINKHAPWFLALTVLAEQWKEVNRLHEEQRALKQKLDQEHLEAIHQQYDGVTAQLAQNIETLEVAVLAYEGAHLIVVDTSTMVQVQDWDAVQHRWKDSIGLVLQAALFRAGGIKNSYPSVTNQCVTMSLLISLRLMLTYHREKKCFIDDWVLPIVKILALTIHEPKLDLSVSGLGASVLAMTPPFFQCLIEELQSSALDCVVVVIRQTCSPLLAFACGIRLCDLLKPLSLTWSVACSQSGSYPLTVALFEPPEEGLVEQEKLYWLMISIVPSISQFVVKWQMQDEVDTALLERLYASIQAFDDYYHTLMSVFWLALTQSAGDESAPLLTQDSVMQWLPRSPALVVLLARWLREHQERLNLFTAPIPAEPHNSFQSLEMVLLQVQKNKAEKGDSFRMLSGALCNFLEAYLAIFSSIPLPEKLAFLEGLLGLYEQVILRLSYDTSILEMMGPILRVLQKNIKDSARFVHDASQIVIPPQESLRRQLGIVIGCLFRKLKWSALTVEDFALQDLNIREAFEAMGPVFQTAKDAVLNDDHFFDQVGCRPTLTIPVVTYNQADQARVFASAHPRFLDVSKVIQFGAAVSSGPWAHILQEGGLERVLQPIVSVKDPVGMMSFWNLTVRRDILEPALCADQDDLCEAVPGASRQVQMRGIQFFGGRDVVQQMLWLGMSISCEVMRKIGRAAPTGRLSEEQTRQFIPVFFRILMSASTGAIYFDARYHHGRSQDQAAQSHQELLKSVQHYFCEFDILLMTLSQYGSLELVKYFFESLLNQMRSCELIDDRSDFVRAFFYLQILMKWWSLSKEESIEKYDQFLSYFERLLEKDGIQFCFFRGVIAFLLGVAKKVKQGHMQLRLIVSTQPLFDMEITFDFLNFLLKVVKICDEQNSQDFQALSSSALSEVMAQVALGLVEMTIPITVGLKFDFPPDSIVEVYPFFAGKVNKVGALVINFFQFDPLFVEHPPLVVNANAHAPKSTPVVTPLLSMILDFSKEEAPDSLIQWVMAIDVLRHLTTWALVNSGTCDWTSYQIIYDSLSSSKVLTLPLLCFLLRSFSYATTSPSGKTEFDQDIPELKCPAILTLVCRSVVRPEDLQQQCFEFLTRIVLAMEQLLNAAEKPRLLKAFTPLVRFAKPVVAAAYYTGDYRARTAVVFLSGGVHEGFMLIEAIVGMCALLPSHAVSHVQRAMVVINTALEFMLQEMSEVPKLTEQSEGNVLHAIRVFLEKLLNSPVNVLAYEFFPLWIKHWFVQFHRESQDRELCLRALIHRVGPVPVDSVPEGRAVLKFIQCFPQLLVRVNDQCVREWVELIDLMYASFVSSSQGCSRVRGVPKESDILIALIFSYLIDCVMKKQDVELGPLRIQIVGLERLYKRGVGLHAFQWLCEMGATEVALLLPVFKAFFQPHQPFYRKCGIASVDVVEMESGLKVEIGYNFLDIEQAVERNVTWGSVFSVLVADVIMPVRPKSASAKRRGRKKHLKQQVAEDSGTLAATVQAAEGFSVNVPQEPEQIEREPRSVSGSDDSSKLAVLSTLSEVCAVGLVEVNQQNGCSDDMGKDLGDSNVQNQASAAICVPALERNAGALTSRATHETLQDAHIAIVAALSVLTEDPELPARGQRDVGREQTLSVFHGGLSFYTQGETYWGTDSGQFWGAAVGDPDSSQFNGFSFRRDLPLRPTMADSSLALPRPPFLGGMEAQYPMHLPGQGMAGLGHRPSFAAQYPMHLPGQGMASLAHRPPFADRYSMYPPSQSMAPSFHHEAPFAGRMAMPHPAHHNALVFYPHGAPLPYFAPFSDSSVQRPDFHSSP